MSAFFSILLAVSLAKYYWEQYKNGFVVSLINMYLSQALKPASDSSNGSGISKALKQISGVHHLEYTFGKKVYTLVLPTDKKLKWHKAVATFEDGHEIDVTEDARAFAGPNGNFFGFHYEAKHLIRGASSVILIRDDQIVKVF